MKKILSIVITFALVLSLGSLTAFAAPITAPGTGDTTVTYTVAEPTYTVTIPAEAELDTEFTVKAENVANLQTSQALTVRVTDWTKSATGNGFVLANGSEYIPCTVRKGESGGEISLGDTVLTAEDDETAPIYIAITDPDGVYVPGTYTGTMTFTIAVENVGK